MRHFNAGRSRSAWIHVLLCALDQCAMDRKRRFVTPEHVPDAPVVRQSRERRVRSVVMGKEHVLSAFGEHVVRGFGSQFAHHEYSRYVHHVDQMIECACHHENLVATRRQEQHRLHPDDDAPLALDREMPGFRAQPHEEALSMPLGS
jgi:hypothetical protein